MGRLLLTLGWRLLRLLLFRLDAERAHRLVLGLISMSPVLHGRLIRLFNGAPHHSNDTTVGGMRFPNPVGLAAGLDKDGEAIPFWPYLGFGFIEIGTVTAHAQSGNPQPRMFRLVPERALINRMGFNNEGAEALALRLEQLKSSGSWPSIPVGVNIGKSKITPVEDAISDYLHSVGCLYPWADYFTVNVSSPNTPQLRSLQQAEQLRALLAAVVPAAQGTPVMVKFSPDLPDEDLDAAVEVAIETGCAGIIATNTSRTRPDTTDRLNETGGMSGAPLWPLAKARIGRILQQANGRIHVIGAGGVSTVEQAQELMNMGCAAIQIYSALVFQGPALPHRLSNGLQLGQE